VLIGFADQIEHVVGNPMQQIFSLPQGGFGASALGDVPDDAEDSRRLAFNVQRRYLDDNLTPSAIVTDDAGFVSMDREFVMQETGIIVAIDMCNGWQEQFAVGFIDDFRKIQTEQFFKGGVAALIPTVEILEKYRIRRQSDHFIEQHDSGSGRMTGRGNFLPKGILYDIFWTFGLRHHQLHTLKGP
jgi:hypothetical protein